jgi:flavin-dependent dehydrogenase
VKDIEEYDVALVGAGLAGLQCARLLGRKGLRVLLADRKPSLDQVHTTGIFVRRTLEDFDIPEDCLGPAIRHVDLYSPAHRVLHLESDREEFRIGRMAQLYDRYLNQCLEAGVKWLPSATYLDCTQLNDKSVVRFRLGSGIKSIATRFLIGGDGARSRVARDLQLDRNSEWIVGVEDVFEEASFDGTPRLRCFLNPRLAPGYIAWITSDGEQAHVGVAGYPNRFEPLAALEQFQARSSQLFDLRHARRVERRGGRIPVGGILKTIVNKHGLLIGDAAGAVSPLTAGGLDPCMRLSTLAADVTAMYLENGDPSILSHYSGEKFRSKFTSRIWARQVASRVNSVALAELACGALRFPLLKALAKKVFFGRGSFPDVLMKPHPSAS